MRIADCSTMHTWPSSVTFHFRVSGNDDGDAADDGTVDEAIVGTIATEEDSGLLLLACTRRLLSATIGVE